MTIKKEISFSDFKPWSGAVENFNRIISEGKADEAEAVLQDFEPAEGWTETDINDFLWFNADELFEALGMRPGNAETKTAEEIAKTWQEVNDLFKLQRLEFCADMVRAHYFELDDETHAEKVEEMKAEDVARLFLHNLGEIDAESNTVFVWGE